MGLDGIGYKAALHRKEATKDERRYPTRPRTEQETRTAHRCTARLPAHAAKDRPSRTIWDVNAPPLPHRRCGGHSFNLSRAFTVPVYRREMAPGTEKPGRPPPRRQPTGLSSVPRLRRAR
ncbi:hypothetical protein GCM10027028_08900 [Streptomyces sundarbansensis]